MTFATFVIFVVSIGGQADITDSQLQDASGGTTVRLGSARGDGPVATLPLEVYVARVLAGEGEPKAADGAYQALAVAIRTYALANLGRHARDGFDLCDSTHCQVPRTATPVSRRAALATAGQVLTYEGAPAELFYSASCGGYSESAAQVWPGADYPYLQAVPDDVHESDAPWTLELTLQAIGSALARAGFEGHLRDLRVEARSSSGRASRIALGGLLPAVIAGDQFRAAIGATTLRSTAFSIEREGASVRFTGRGYGHGVGMCVIGAGRRAARGEAMDVILSHYYPGLQLTRVGGPTRVVEPPTLRVLPASPASAAAGGVGGLDVQRLTGRMHDALASMLGVSIAPVTVRVHETIESFRLATGRPWWVSSVSDGTSIDLAPVAVLEQRDGLETTLRTAVAELLVAQTLNGRPLWVRVGAARYFGLDHRAGHVDSDRPRNIRCPSDAELTLAISAAAHRDATARADACFARAYAVTRDWRNVR